jgi:hypothetical protein
MLAHYNMHFLGRSEVGKNVSFFELLFFQKHICCLMNFDYTRALFACFGRFGLGCREPREQIRFRKTQIPLYKNHIEPFKNKQTNIVSTNKAWQFKSAEYK